jgi:hypothetical protein
VAAAGAALAVALAVLAAVGAAGAQSAGVIRACVNTNSGAVKIVGSGDGCAGSERLLTWNVQGPAGPQGPLGPAGASGVTGLETVTRVVTLPPGAGSVVHANVTCPAGKVVLSGGYRLWSPEAAVQVTANHPNPGDVNE